MSKKAEYMTDLGMGDFVRKDDIRIVFRGKLDSISAEILLAQSLIHPMNKTELIADLDSVLEHIYYIMRCEVLDEVLEDREIIGMSSDEVHEHSHNTMKYYGVSPMIRVTPDMGVHITYINKLRAMVRELEPIATEAFVGVDGSSDRLDILRELNRMSSALHVIMCKEITSRTDD